MHLNLPFKKLNDLSQILQYHKSPIGPSFCEYKEFTHSLCLGQDSEYFKFDKFSLNHTFCLELENALVYQGAHFIVDPNPNISFERRAGGATGYSPSNTKQSVLLSQVGIDTCFEDNFAWDNIFPEIPTSNIQHMKGTYVVLTGVQAQKLFFHFIYDGISRCAMLEKYGYNLQDPTGFIISQEPTEYQKAWFDKLGILDRIVVAPSSSFLLCEKLIVPSLSYLSLDAVGYIKSVFHVPYPKARKKIFIGRGKATLGRHMENELELFERLAALGFEYCTMDGLSIHEQASIFASASHIVAPHGAALSNIIFCKKGTKVLEFFGDNYLNGVYYVLCNQLGLKHFNCIGTAIGGNDYKSNFVIPSDVDLDAFLL